VAVLAVESATELAGVALADASGMRVTVTVEGGRRHGESIAPAVEFVCARAGIALGELDALAVDVGPGLFTGLRVGVATVKALAFGLGLRVVTATSLELLALAATRVLPPSGEGASPLLVPVVDARRGLLFSARFLVTGDSVTRVGDDVLCAPDDLAGELAALGRGGQRALCLGDGARRYAELLGAVAGVTVAGVATAHPDVGVLAELAVARHADGLAVPVEKVQAHYLREADVRINWEQRIAPRARAGS
jgi:tRNA threonylcarbamoyladenosine biosynthesis protein TsaB